MNGEQNFSYFFSREMEGGTPLRPDIEQKRKEALERRRLAMERRKLEADRTSPANHTVAPPAQVVNSPQPFKQREMSRWPSPPKTPEMRSKYFTKSPEELQPRAMVQMAKAPLKAHYVQGTQHERARVPKVLADNKKITQFFRATDVPFVLQPSATSQSEFVDEVVRKRKAEENEWLAEIEESSVRKRLRFSQSHSQIAPVGTPIQDFSAGDATEEPITYYEEAQSVSEFERCPLCKQDDISNDLEAICNHIRECLALYENYTADITSA